MCLTVPPENCIPNWVRLSSCSDMNTWDRGVRTVLRAMNIPSGHYSSCRLICIIVRAVLHTTALFFPCLCTWWCLSYVWGSALQKFSLPVACSGDAYQKRAYQDFWRGSPMLEWGGRRRFQPPLLTNLAPGWPSIHLLHMHKHCSSHHARHDWRHSCACVWCQRDKDNCRAWMCQHDPLLEDIISYSYQDQHTFVGVSAFSH